MSRQSLKNLNLIPKDFPHVRVNHVEGADIQTADNSTCSEFGPDFEQLKAKFPTVFDGQCKIMKGPKAHIDVDPDAVPVSTGAFRSIPEPQMPALKREIDTLLDQGVIEKVEKATPWLHPIVVVAKKNTEDV